MAAIARSNIFKIAQYSGQRSFARHFSAIQISQAASKAIASRNTYTTPGLRCHKHAITSQIACCYDNGSLPLLHRNTCTQHRAFSTDPDTPSRHSLPQLMAFPKIVWPSMLKSLKNWILVQFIIRPYFDREFTLPDFVAGSKHALQVVSASMAAGETKTLNGLVSSDALVELHKSVSGMTLAQRNEMIIDKEDIYLTFPYQVGIMFDETNEEIQKRWVEITMVFHVLRGLNEMQKQGIMPPLNIGMMPEYRDKISICNYRFIKEFTQGAESDWTINVVNHFKPADYVNE